MKNYPVHGAEILTNDEKKIYTYIFEQAHMIKQCMHACSPKTFNPVCSLEIEKNKTVLQIFRQKRKPNAFFDIQ